MNPATTAPAMRALSVALCLAMHLALTGCYPSDATNPSATVYFLLDAPLCSSVIPVRFNIDGVTVGTDTFLVGLPSPHVKSRGFLTNPGQHLLKADMLPGTVVWPAKSVRLEAGFAFTDTLPAYCS